MISHFRYLLKMVLLWLVLFNLARTVFILYFFQKFHSFSAVDFVDVYIHAFRLDLSTTMYVLVLPLLVSLPFLFITNRKFFMIFSAVYNYFVLFTLSIITVSDLGIYSSWGTKLNQRAISFLAYPDEAFASMSSSPIIPFILICLGIMCVGVMLYRLLFRKDAFLHNRSRPVWNIGKNWNAAPTWYLLPVPFLAYAFVTVVFIRGGLQLIPINESSAYFSQHTELNHAATNTAWYLVHSELERTDYEGRNPYLFYPAAETQQVVKELMTPSGDSTTQILTTPKPNVVFILMEGFTADVVEDLGGMKGVTPVLHSLINDGILFNQIYSPGSRTDQGIVSILSAFPAQPVTSIIRQPEKMEQLPTITNALAVAGYSTSFYYGGEIGFGNMKAFVLHNGFKYFTSIQDYSADMMSNKWGAHDGFVLDKQVKELASQQQPFFSFLLTLSSHEPYVVPMPTKFDDGTDAMKFANSCYYTDLSIGKYFEQAKKQPWYSNTLFILCADHGNRWPMDRAGNEPKRYHVPLIFFGDVIKPEFRGKQFDVTGSQVDIVATLLKQLGMDASKFKWSNNLLNTYRNSFVYYGYDEGAGWVYPGGSVTYDCRSRLPNFWYSSPADSARLKQCKAYLQEMFTEYLGY